jgi:hypothetical protein
VLALAHAADEGGAEAVARAQGELGAVRRLAWHIAVTRRAVGFATSDARGYITPSVQHLEQPLCAT